MSAADQIKKFKEKYGKEITEITREVTKETGSMAYDLLFLRTKAGQGTNGPLKELSKSYVDFRKRWSSFLADDTSPSESNLTATGQLLDAMFLRVVAGRFIIKVNSKKRDQGLGGGEVEEIKRDVFKGKGQNKKKVGEKTTGVQSKLTNDQVRKFVEDAGRVFLEFNDDEKRQIREFALNMFRDKLKKFIK